MTPAPLPDPPRRPRTARLATLAAVTLGTAAVCALVTAPTAAAAPTHGPTATPPLGPSAAPTHGPAAAPSHGTGTDHQIAAAASYVAALVDHDPSSVPLHPAATRVENGVPTGFSGPQIRFDLAHGPQYRVIERVRDERYRRTGDTVTADYLLDVGVGTQLTTARVHETFGLVNGLIKTIVADIAATPSVPAP